ncbi:MAG: LLM class F420-dependent oxidoreductase [Gammaproteobacteria bacterium]|nr:LLM class F420-dependent oxidoreductase [Gammaproteobacteria bacterium]
MKTAIAIGGVEADRKGGFTRSVEYALECEKLGVDVAWSAEAWGTDAFTPLAYLAAKTTRMRLASGIAQVSARAPGNIAMTALSLAAMSEGRFMLGLGVSGPQVVEGLHGVPFAHPLARMKELVDILKLAFAGEKLRYQGQHYMLPLPGGEGKALRLAHRPNADIPIFLATLGPKALEYTGEVADGWIGTSFTPATAESYFEPMRRGAARAGRNFDDIELAVGAVVGVGDNVEEMIAGRKPALAFQLGGMGSPKTNFYNQAYRRIGYEDVAVDVQRLWVAGRRDEAVARIPDEMALQASVIGTRDMVRDRLREYAESGIDILQLQVMGRGTDAKLETIELVHGLIEENQAA